MRHNQKDNLGQLLLKAISNGTSNRVYHSIDSIRMVFSGLDQGLNQIIV